MDINFDIFETSKKPLCDKMSNFSSHYHHGSLYAKQSFLRDFTDVRQTEESLADLLSDFHQGKLHAFGENITLENMCKVREQQENLARLHFELNSQQSTSKQQESNPATPPAFSNGQPFQQTNQSIQTNENDRTIGVLFGKSTTNPDQKESLNLANKSKNNSQTNLMQSESNTGSSNQLNKSTLTTNMAGIQLPTTPTSASSDDSSNGAAVDIFGMTMLTKPFSKSNMIKLTQNLQNLCESIELLQSKNNPTEPFGYE